MSVVVWAKARSSLGDLAARGAATTLFVFLLARKPDPSLLAYAATFTLPHFALLAASLAAKTKRVA